MIDTWPEAYAVTQAVEIPVYLFAARYLKCGRRWLYAAGASTLTHPVVWFAFPWETANFFLTYIAAESFAVLAEALWGRLLGVRQALWWALAANGASVLVGELIRFLGPSPT